MPQETEIKLVYGINISADIRMDHLISLEEMRQAIDNVRKSKKINFNIKDFGGFLMETNMVLMGELQVSDEEMKTRLIVAYCAYNFGDPYLGLVIPNSSKTTFQGFVEKKYGLANCLDISFSRVKFDPETEDQIEPKEKENFYEVSRYR